jgi:hypothetical protein
MAHHRIGKKPFIERESALWLAENAHNIWEYSESGSGLVWKINRRGTRGIGKQAGGKQLRYYSVRYQNKYYLCHHVVWTLFNGLIPEEMVIDHVDRNGHNNNISNLKIKTCRENGYNKHANGVSNYKGVSWFERDKKWLARLGTKEGFIFLGYHDTALEAAIVWDKKAKHAGRRKEDLNFPEMYELY